MSNLFLSKIDRHALIIIFTIYAFIATVPLSRANNDITEQTYYFLTDHLGSVDAVLDEDGNVVERKDYLPFGEDRMTIGDNDEDYGYTGKEKDDETGLNYYGARYYDSKLARFTQIDPLVLNKSDKPINSVLESPQSLNGYSYVLNNPLKYVDPTGEKSTLIQSLARSVLKFLTSGNENEVVKSIVKSSTSVVVTRDVNKGTSIRGKIYYKDNLSVKVGAIKLNNIEVQSTIDGTTASENTDNLQNGTSYDAKIGKNGASSPYIKDTLQIDGAYFFHRPAEDNGKPYSLGCTIPKTNADKEEVMNILRKDLGFKKDETVKYSFEAAPKSEKDEDESED